MVDWLRRVVGSLSNWLLPGVGVISNWLLPVLRMLLPVAVLLSALLMTSHVSAVAPVLSLNNSGPACLDSHLVFTAMLHPAASRLPVRLFRWTSNASDWGVVTGAGQVQLVAVLGACDGVVAGVYRMTVCVQPTRDHCLTEATSDFLLTDDVGGELVVEQDVSAGWPRPDVYLTSRDVTLRPLMRDTFPGARLTCVWGGSGVPPRPLGCDAVTTRFTTPGVHVVSVNVTAHLATNCSVDRDEGRRRSGYLQRHILLQDPVTAIEYTGNTSVLVNSTFQLNFSCDGSGPFRVVWTLSDWTPGGASLRSDRCGLVIRVWMATCGQYSLHFTASNAVSNATRKLRVTVYTPEPPVPAIPAYIPVMCVLIGCLCVACVAVAFYRDRHRATVETADFDYRRWRHRSGSRPGPVTAAVALSNQLTKLISQKAGNWRSGRLNGQRKSYGAVI